jgi:hypothetical protein
MSSSTENKPTEEATLNEPDATGQEFGEPRKMNETFDTEEDESDCSNDAEETNEDGEEELAVEDAAMDMLDQLVELFIEKNGREPTQEEVEQWIDVFKSLKIEDGSPQTDNPANDDAANEETPTASE